MTDIQSIQLRNINNSDDHVRNSKFKNHKNNKKNLNKTKIKINNI